MAPPRFVYRRWPRPIQRPGLKPDWNINIGNNAFVDANTFPAKWTFNVNATPSCANDYIVFPTGVNGSATQASIVGFNQLYSTQGAAGGLCAHDGPTALFSYVNLQCPFTGTLLLNSNDQIQSSPVISFDGTKVAWVTTTGKVQVLTIGTTGNNGSPTAPNCVGPIFLGGGNNAVLASVTLSGVTGANAVTNSAVYVDYFNDIGYVGDNFGKLHKLTGVFAGTLSEVTTGGWPVTVSSAATKTLTGPVFDSVSNNIFIADDENNAGNLFYVRLAAGSAGSCNPASNGGTPPCVGNATLAVSTKAGITDSPLVDSSNGWVYTQTSNADGTNAKIYQANTTLTSSTSANVGGNNPNDLHSGAFDNTYFNAGPTDSNSRYYVCGLNGAATASVVYQFGFNASGVLNTSPTTSLAVASANNTPCSPLTESYNPNASGGAKDWLFLSVADHGNGGNCNNNPCVFQIGITNAPASLSVGQGIVSLTNKGTSGIVVDNVGTQSETSNIYFSPLMNHACTAGGTGVCATKLHQSDLQ
jgi:hypothetical protein